MTVTDLRAVRTGFGVDRLSLSFPLRGEPDPSSFDSRAERGHGEQASTTYSVNVPLSWQAGRAGQRDTVTSSVFVGATKLGGSWWGKIESNPARFADPDGCSLLPFDQLDTAAETMWAVACDRVQVVDGLEEAKVKRVDLARDFRGVRNPGGYVWGLLNVKRPYAKRQYVFSDPARRNAETLWAGSGAGGVRLYDQHAAYAGKGAPEGSIRWEVEARGDWLAKAERSLSTSYGRMSVARLVELAESRWEWSGMGIEVASTSDVITKLEGLVTAKGYPDPITGQWVTFTAAKADRMLGLLLRESRGLNRASCKYTASEYSKLKRHLGVVITPQLFAEQDDAPVGRLDWSTGREVAA